MRLQGQPRQWSMGGTIYVEGGIISINSNGNDVGIGPTGYNVVIRVIDTDNHVMHLESDMPLDGWDNDVGFHCKQNNTGRRLSFNDVKKYFNYKGGVSVEKKKQYIGTDLEFRDINLKGEPCTIIDSVEGTSDVFVEFERNINACGCDGLGKHGHCLAVNSNILVSSKNKIGKVKDDIRNAGQPEQAALDIDNCTNLTLEDARYIVNNFLKMCNYDFQSLVFNGYYKVSLIEEGDRIVVSEHTPDGVTEMMYDSETGALLDKRIMDKLNLKTKAKWAEFKFT